jgi:hypothetical protein
VEVFEEDEEEIALVAAGMVVYLEQADRRYQVHTDGYNVSSLNISRQN